MTSTVVQDRHVLNGELELALAPSKTHSKLHGQEHPGLLLGVPDAADGPSVGMTARVPIDSFVKFYPPYP